MHRVVITHPMTLVLTLDQGRPAAGGGATATLSGTDIVVGSAPECDWRIDGIAPRHCQFGFRGGRWLVVDLGGGTVVDGRALEAPAPIALGSMIGIGAARVRVGALAATAAADRSAPHGGGGGGTEALARLLVAGVVDQLARRARAKAEMGVEATQVSVGLANPLKTLPADRAFAALAAAAPGTMPAEAAVADAFADLEAHQDALLAGMQQALAATLDRFSPKAIRARAQDGGLMARVIPKAREATLWEAYEREFDGVVRGSADAFVDLFAAEFRRAYQAFSSGLDRSS